MLIRAIIVICLSVGQAEAHSWYPLECCGGRDCRSIPCEEIKSDGPDIIWKGFRTKREFVRHSLDNKCHICLTDESDTRTLPRCWFMPREKTFMPREKTPDPTS